MLAPAQAEDRAVTPLSVTVEWVYKRLKFEQRQPNPDLRVVAQLTYVLAEYLAQNPEDRVRSLLQLVQDKYLDRPMEGLSCRHKRHLFRLAQVLSRAQTDGAGELLDRVRANWREGCLEQGTRVELVSRLLLLCEYAEDDLKEASAAELAELVRWQSQYGAVLEENGQPSLQLTERAMLAWHLCQEDEDAARAARRYLDWGLQQLMDRRSFDYALSTMLALRRGGQPVADETKLLAVLKSRIRWDGGICFAEVPGCRSHWHTTSMLLHFLVLSGL